MKKQLLTVILASTLAFGSLVAPSVVSADEIDTKIEQSNNKIKELADKAATAQAQLAKVRENINVIRAKAEKLQTQQATLNEEVATLNDEIETLTAKIEKRDARIKDQARAVQTGNMSSSYLEAVLDSENLSDAITRVAATAQLVSASNDLLKEQEQDKKAVESKKTETEVKLKEIQENAAALEAQKGELVDQEYQQTILVSTISAEKATEESKKDAFIKEKEEAEKARAEQARLAREAAAQAAAEREAQEREAARVIESSTNNNVASSNNSNTTSNSNVSTVTPPTSNNNSGSTGGSTTPPTSNNNSGSTGGSTTTPPTSNNNSGSTGGSTVTPPASGVNGGAIVAEAAKYLGTPYVWGGKSPSGFDCSGFTAYVFRQAAGKEIGGWTVPQESAGTKIAVSQAQAGDLYFWGGSGGTYHVAIATGGGSYIHAPKPGDVVKYGTVSGWAPSFAVRVR